MFLMLLVAMCAIVPALIPINVGVSLALAYSLGAINVANPAGNQTGAFAVHFLCAQREAACF